MRNTAHLGADVHNANFSFLSNLKAAKPPTG